MIKIEWKKFLRAQTFLGFGYSQLTNRTLDGDTIVHRHTLNEWGWRYGQDSMMKRLVPMDLILWIIGKLNKWA